jgi:hypothetical protein
MRGSGIRDNQGRNKIIQTVREVCSANRRRIAAGQRDYVITNKHLELKWYVVRLGETRNAYRCLVWKLK